MKKNIETTFRAIEVTWYQDLETITAQFHFSSIEVEAADVVVNDNTIVVRKVEVIKTVHFYAQVQEEGMVSKQIRSGISVTLRKKTPAIWPRLTKLVDRSIRLDVDKSPFIEEPDDMDISEEMDDKKFDTMAAIKTLREEQWAAYESQTEKIAEEINKHLDPIQRAQLIKGFVKELENKQ